ncbi:MAG: phosphoribosylamine--glycine ligase, partial [Victivallales bacterium]|nr:phosphoribosylamine--glycine ligase [Victivallales bacterium]
MNVLIVGAGGREHALAWKMAQSPLVGRIYCTPGNPGMRGVEAIGITDLNELADFAQAHDVGLTMVGPEATLCAGIADIFRARGLRIVGPDKFAAQLE